MVGVEPIWLEEERAGSGVGCRELVHGSKCKSRSLFFTRKWHLVKVFEPRTSSDHNCFVVVTVMLVHSFVICRKSTWCNVRIDWRRKGLKVGIQILKLFRWETGEA